MDPADTEHKSLVALAKEITADANKVPFKIILQRTSGTVTLMGISKSVTVADCHRVSDDFQYKKVLFRTKKLSL